MYGKYKHSVDPKGQYGNCRYCDREFPNDVSQCEYFEDSGRRK